MADGGRYKGPRDARADYFDDYMGDNSPPTIFDGDGMRDYDTVRTTAAQEGIIVEMHCRSCSKGARIVLEWPELFIVAHAPATNMLPAGWKRSDVNSSTYPDLKCSCGSLCCPMVSPDWAAKQVKSALESGLLTRERLASEPAVQHVQQMLQQRRASYG